MLIITLKIHAIISADIDQNSLEEAVLTYFVTISSHKSAYNTNFAFPSMFCIFDNSITFLCVIFTSRNASYSDGCIVHNDQVIG